ncbi:MAG: LysR family transcriptional regulator [Deltaproteobacteria bacterium]|nr:LysR family transcriptional regulator [Deltaproteobacteria bacterium]
MDKLAAMQTFVAIVDAGSLTAAAHTLGKAPPTVVRSLSMLEQALGARLLQRTTRRMSLTVEGRQYLEQCRTILAHVADAEQALSSQHAEPRGELRVTAPMAYGRLKVVPAVTRFLQAHEQVSVDLVLLDRVVNLVEEGIDVGIRIAPLVDSSAIATRIGEVRRVVVASPRLLRRHRAPQHPRGLAQLPTVRFEGGSAASAWTFQDNGRRVTVPVVGRLTCNHVEASIDACAQGLGFGQFLSYQVESLVAQRQLRVVLRRFEPAPIPVHVVFAHARLMSPRNRAFVDWMKAEL